MGWRRSAGFSFLILGVVGAAVPAEELTVADAAEQGNGVLIRTLLQGGANVNTAQVDGMTALHWAAYRDDAETARFLVQSGATVNAKNHYGVPPLSLAATNGNPDIVALLLDAGADANASLRGGETVLMTASRTGSLEAVEALLSHGADPGAREHRDQTSLMWAAAEGHVTVVEALIDAGADIHAKLPSGFTPLFFAVRGGHMDVSQMFLAAGVDVNEVLERVKDGPDEAVNNASYRPVDDGMSPLLMAVRNGHFELAVALVKAGADPNDQRTGFAPLHTMSWVRKPDASDRGDPVPVGSGSLTSLEFMRALVKIGADVNMRLHDGKRPPHTASELVTEGATAFLMAADRADIAMMQLLLDLGADPSIPNIEFSTPLMAASGLGTTAPEEEAGTESEALAATQLLLEIGADIDTVDGNGDTAMHGAAYGSFPAVVQLLADSGADIHIWKHRNKFSRTPLFIAEGHRTGLPRQSRATIEVVTRLMVSAGVPTDGQRPEFKDQYETPPTPPEELKKAPKP